MHAVRSSSTFDALSTREFSTDSHARQAKQLQASLLAIVDRVETVKEEHDKLEGGNKFLQQYGIVPGTIISSLLTSFQIHRRTDPNNKIGRWQIKEA